jgi:hypothetical protein
LQEVELDVYDRGTQLKNPKKIKEYDATNPALRQKYGKTLGCVALSRKFKGVA